MTTDLVSRAAHHSPHRERTQAAGMCALCKWKWRGVRAGRVSLGQTQVVRHHTAKLGAEHMTENLDLPWTSIILGYFAGGLCRLSF